MPIRYRQFSKNKALNNLPFIVKQQGSSLILALFVIIILTLLGSILMRMISTSSETVSQEVLGTRAYMAANSAMQAELQLLFPLNVTSSTSCDIAFIDKDYDLQTSLNEDIPGLYDCTASTSCEKYHTGLDGTNYYRISSTGQCGSGTMEASSKVLVKSSRTIQVEARSL
ncbi:hypothetical protein [Colwellia sp. 12G3]|uniref:hypothetical protein n=1 Tax=Colwellia sp. 12G3 TaxID=2058299 RepID=UPI000C34DB77|nr:hypothetical protein [Colwellia sp. 12G3]PKI13149.1 hypothetical protein CXF71_20875 [Colwellia sp. 12G3]